MSKGKVSKVSKKVVKVRAKDIVSVVDGMYVVKHPNGNRDRYNIKYAVVEGYEYLTGVQQEKATPKQQKVSNNKKGNIPDGLSRNEYLKAGGNIKDFKAYIKRQEKLWNEDATGTVSTKTPKKQKKSTLVSRSQMTESFNSMDRLTQLYYITECIDSIREHL